MDVLTSVFSPPADRLLLLRSASVAVLRLDFADVAPASGGLSKTLSPTGESLQRGIRSSFVEIAGG